jgi:vacuolar-type H+-ATPase subunit H
MDSNGKNANSKNCPQSIMPCNQNSNAATSLASHVLEVFQTPARSKSSNHRDEKNTPVPARGDVNREKVTPSPGHDTSKKVPNHQTLSKEKEELNALLGEVSEQTNCHISLKDKMEEMIASSKDNLLQEIQYAKESLEDVISRAKTLGQCLNDKLDLLKTTESNIIQSLERKGEEERESICTRGGEIMEEIIRKGDDKLKNHLEYLHEEKVSMLESIKTAVEEMGSKVQKTISDETKKEFEEVKKFMDEIMMKGKDLCDSSRRCMEVDSSTSKPREDDLPTKKSSRLKLNRKDNDKRFESSPKVMITDDTEKPEIAFVEDRPRNGTAKIRRTRKKSTKDNILQRNDTKAPIKSVEVHSVPNDLELSPLSNKSQMNTYGYSDSNGGTQLEARDDKIHEGNQVVPSSGTTDPCNIVPAQNSNSASVKSKTGINDGVQSRSEPALTVNHERTDSVPTSKTQDTLHGIPLRPRTARCSRFKDIPKPTETPFNAYSGSHFNNSENFEDKYKMTAIHSPDKCTPKMLVRKSIISDPPKASGRRKKRTYQRLCTKNKTGEEYHYKSKRTLLGTLSISNLTLDERQSSINSPPLFSNSTYQYEVLDNDKVLSAPLLPDFEDSRYRTTRKTLSLRTRPITNFDVDSSSKGEDVFEFR